jgi:hypothetical protein
VNPLTKQVISMAGRMYAFLLRAYPADIRTVFGEEMQVTFSDAVQGNANHGTLPLIKTIFIEFFDFPRALWQAHFAKKTAQGSIKDTDMYLNDPMNAKKPATFGQMIVGSLPFFLFGLLMILLKMRGEWNFPLWMDTVGKSLFAFLLLLPAIGFAAGWVRSFPRWSYPYTAMAFLLAWYMTNASSPGLILFGYPFFGRELWGWRAWIPLGVAFVVALTISRSLEPVRKFFAHLWEDWSIFSYLLAGLLPFLIMVAFDEIDSYYSLYFMVPLAVLLVGMVVLYLKSPQDRQRVLVLTVGILTVLAATALGSASYWLAHNGAAEDFARRSLNQAGMTALVVLLPAWLELLRRSMGRLRVI